ncbi:MAG TPA: hypothetical protein VNF04_13510 [Stellaceae bacterium]|nr:hypothetical protein [Stellaceae bacterium]
MAAFNWVRFDAVCPVCRERASIRAQLHVAAAFEGDARGRFCNRTYRLGEKLRWWDPAHKDFGDWKIGGEPGGVLAGTVLECCYAYCMRCARELYAVIEISDLMITKIVEIGPEASWPSVYAR